ncbi:uncharacterized protein LOC107430685 isoform X1 [Ziziphus jujuba]|uniref:Uncharacterized protein LOC107430685 isoform X1 n=1 Tax=Ziziphus jujuba TaxID=326968 RepID=A0A6P4BDI8_ZIZJJ|nr:uncharacterized protein LOC107430685 isoform X1 [Ziziphus jujuba]XP_015897035.1 uncharacterized protein LOC107430685 isoform X1 [Ziziphus jujuba]XP_060674231.1 uncharacterized protein LOC107430685 isoform X1 [Ziziphus jujuba]
MEGRKPMGSSSSSFTSELFGSKETSSSTGIFGSIFAPSSKVLGRESLRSEVPGKRQDWQSESWNSKPGTPGSACCCLIICTNHHDTSKISESDSHNVPDRDMSSIYQEQRVQPCHLSSSIYYGGQDIYSHPQSTQNQGLNSVFKKDGNEDDSGSASRGNWWKGSLYY